MFRQRIQSASQRRQSDRAPRVAVVLNGNARHVDANLVSHVRRYVDANDLYISHSLEQAQFIARHIINRGYDAVLCGGGDGTLSQVATDLLSLKPAQMPALGVLRMGTGNAIADALGAADRDHVGADIELAKRTLQRERSALVQVEGRVAPFAGVGVDSMILDDYKTLKNAAKNTPLKRVCEGPMGYGLAIATRTVWRLASQPSPEVIIRNEGAPARALNAQGEASDAPILRGNVLYQGPATIAAASTIPCFGFGFKLFPFADQRSDRFQLRIGACSLTEILPNIPAMFRGEFQSDRMWDYSCSAISIETRLPQPIQVSGDVIGLRRKVRIGLAKVDLLLGSRKRVTAETSHNLEATDFAQVV